MITTESIEKVREADIVKVVQSYCADLKKEGANYKCKSPFASEKTASFVVSPVKQIFKDFSSGLGGDAIKFVQSIESCEFIEAVKKIAEICNIYLEEEKVSENVKRKREQQTTLSALAKNIAGQYVKNFKALSGNHWAKTMATERGITAEALIDFQIGFASEDNEVTTACSANGRLSQAIEIGATTQGTAGSYDAFKNRLIFPILNHKSEAVGFGGRRQNGPQFEKYAKYINSKESPIYNKSAILYGLNLAKQAIAAQGFAVITEGYTDVIGLHINGVENSIATCGTALTDQHLLLLKRYCKHVVLLRDGDPAGKKAAMREIDICLANEFKVSICNLPEGHDPDSYARELKTETAAFVLENMQDALLYKANLLNEKAGEDHYQKSEVVSTLCSILFLIKNETVRNGYIKDIGLIIKEKQAVLKANIGVLEKAHQEKLNSQKEKPTSRQLGLPEGAEAEQFLKDRFCEIGNSYHFQSREGFFEGTNFKVDPLFHIKGRKENKRLCEITNTYNKKELVDFDSESFVSHGDFKRQLIRLGYFVFKSGANTQHFDLVAEKILKGFNTALELQTMGWNSKGFYAFGNGVYWKNEFKNVNNYGIIHLEGVDQEEDDYNEKVDFYYSPAFSVMHKKNQDGDDPYENDRKFVYKKAPISLENWMQQLIDVFGEKGRMGIVFNFAAIFRDLFLSNYDYFPLLGGFGEKDSGKSGFGKMLQNFFFFQEEPLELNQATLVGLNRRLSRTTNTVTFLDEYNNKLDEKINQALKGCWNGLGREKGIATTDKRTVVDKINQAIYFAGQYLPTSDDNALQTRTICLQFPNQNYSPEAKEKYNRLIEDTNKGLSSLVVDIVNHRPFFQAELPKTFAEVVRELKTKLKGQEYQERIFGNYAVLIISYKILQSKINFPFDYEAFFDQCVDGILENSNNVADSNGLTGFWNVLQWLFEHSIVQKEKHFKIEKPISVRYYASKAESKDWQNPNMATKVLFLRLNAVHQDYVKEVTKREGVEVIGETTLRNYFKSRPYFIGMVKGKRFEKGVYSCYAFDYDLMINSNVVTLHEELEHAEASPPQKEELPF